MSQQGFDAKAMNEQMTQRLLSAPAQPLPDGGYTIRVLEVPGRRSGTVHQTPGRAAVLRRCTSSWCAPTAPATGRPTSAPPARPRSAPCVETEAYAADEVHGRPAAEAVSAYLAVVTAPWAVAAFGVPDGASVEEVAAQVDRMAVFSLTPDAPDSPADSPADPPTDTPIG